MVTLFPPGLARPAAPTSHYFWVSSLLGPFPRHCWPCHESQFPLVVFRTLEKWGGLEPFVCVSFPGEHGRQPRDIASPILDKSWRAGSRADVHGRSGPGIRASLVYDLFSPWGIGVHCAQDCPRLIKRAKVYISGVSIIGSMETRKDM